MISTKQQTFGAFLTRKRLERDITLRGFAGILELSPVYVCNLEKDRRPAPKQEILNRVVSILNLTKMETEEMLDLAAKSQSNPSISLDLPEYIMERDIVRVALRTAKDVDATDQEWQEFIDRIKQRDKHGRTR